MNNEAVCEYVRKKIDPHQNKDGDVYIASLCVKEGYGQTYGGYLERYEDKGQSQKPSEKEHFLGYYFDKGEKLPTYDRLRCPQLMLFIAEVAGLSNERLVNAFETLKAFEDDHNLRFEQKNGDYLWSNKAVFKEFKSQLCIKDVNKIIREADTWVEVIDKVKPL